MSVKIRKLKADLSKAGLIVRPGKGSDTVWTYALDPSIEVTLVGNDDKDAKPYQIKEIRDALNRQRRQDNGAITLLYAYPME